MSFRKKDGRTGGGLYRFTSVSVTVFHMIQRHDSQALARAIKMRRAELEISQQGVPARGGPSRPTIARWESGDVPEDVRDRTLLQLDKALEWAPGTAREILNGTGPVETKAQETEETATVPAEMFRDLVHAQQNMIKAIKKAGDLDPKVRDAIDQVTDVQTNMLLGLTERLT